MKLKLTPIPIKRDHVEIKLSAWAILKIIYPSDNIIIVTPIDNMALLTANGMRD